MSRDRERKAVHARAPTSLDWFRYPEAETRFFPLGYSRPGRPAQRSVISIEVLKGSNAPGKRGGKLSGGSPTKSIVSYYLSTGAISNRAGSFFSIFIPRFIVVLSFIPVYRVNDDQRRSPRRLEIESARCFVVNFCLCRFATLTFTLLLCVDLTAYVAQSWSE